MLSKLIKYEMKATFRIFPIMYIVLFCSSIIFRLCKILDGTIGNDKVAGTLISISLGFLGFLVCVGIIGMLVISFFLGVYRFYKNYVTDEGYLMHTIPVPTWSLLMSKFIVSIIWMLASTVVSLVSLLIMFFSKDWWNSFVSFIKDVLFPMFGESALKSSLISYVVLFVVSLLSSYLILYFCIALGQVWTKHRILGAVLVYIGTNMVLNIVSTVVSVITLYIDSRMTDNYFIVTSVTNSLLYIVVGVLAFVYTEKIFKKNLNLQ